MIFLKWITCLFIFTIGCVTCAPMEKKSTPTPASAENTSSSSSKNERTLFNEGVKLMLDKKFYEASKKLKEAIAIYEAFPEAHNNLGYCLRKLGPKFYELSLKEYERALVLAPKQPEPYMYRGALHLLMNHKDLALEDYKTLVELKSALAPKLKSIIDGEKELDADSYSGVYLNER
jgi:tetratricopeptide (TPR) repeat protein